MRNRQFTLIELLVVIAIIGILTSIMLPSVSKAREKGKQAVCKNNMKQVYLAVTLYADDNDGTMAPSSWGNRLPAGSGRAYYSDSILTGGYVDNKKDYGNIGKSRNSIYFCPSTPAGEKNEYTDNLHSVSPHN
ncbi:MAG: type II secretion system GspH family protein [Lentisphaerales bacterium]|nr:type II secretion system GspH family protein [Lentisphaerales bacterium]